MLLMRYLFRNEGHCPRSRCDSVTTRLRMPPCRRFATPLKTPLKEGFKNSKNFQKKEF